MIATTLPDAMVLLRALPGDEGEAIAEALTIKGGDVTQMVAAFDVLRARGSLSDAALVALASCAKLIAAGGLHRRGGDAADVLLQRGPDIAGALARLAPPPIELPVPEAINDLTP